MRDDLSGDREFRVRPRRFRPQAKLEEEHLDIITRCSRGDD
jgi:hypothetical protein